MHKLIHRKKRVIHKLSTGKSELSTGSRCIKNKQNGGVDHLTRLRGALAGRAAGVGGAGVGGADNLFFQHMDLET